MRDLGVKWRIAAVVNFYWKEVATVGEFGLKAVTEPNSAEPIKLTECSLF